MAIYKLRVKHFKDGQILLNAVFHGREQAETHAAYIVSGDPDEDWRNIYEVVELAGPSDGKQEGGYGRTPGK